MAKIKRLQDGTVQKTYTHKDKLSIERYFGDFYSKKVIEYMENTGEIITVIEIKDSLSGCKGFTLQLGGTHLRGNGFVSIDIEKLNTIIN